MRKILLSIILLVTTLSFSQSRGVRIGYIDMNYILDKVPDYAEAKNQLDQKVVKWRQEIEIKKGEITKLKDALQAERSLLTKELIEEREEEIAFEEKELLDYQEKRFGPKGDLIIQKSTLVKPIQDQIFTIIQDIADKKKYDFIFDKSSDLTMLFAAQRHDISDQVIRALTRAEKREQLSKKQLKEQDAKEALEDMQDENPDLAERQRILDERKAAREKLMAEKKAQRDSLVAQRKRAAEEKRKKTLEEREAKKNGTVIENDTKETEIKESDKKDNNDLESGSKELSVEEKRKQIEEERKKKLEERKKALEEKRKKILEEREAAKKAKEEEKESE
ncbi:OmpH family outer membrane protein [Flavobacterium okayamense]|uniref:Membrane protein n=1 Tax=Flavobacterium okayamense TaxID=2830782 RepID=A0ABM7S3T6_9FLAO|nr:OmpH family outer membrane protein [Flavobacterium okayamense]BCY28176.1 membrane protein [Flavobacterium okayamense]